MDYQNWQVDQQIYQPSEEEMMAMEEEMAHQSTPKTMNMSMTMPMTKPMSMSMFSNNNIQLIVFAILVGGLLYWLMNNETLNLNLQIPEQFKLENLSQTQMLIGLAIIGVILFWWFKPSLPFLEGFTINSGKNELNWNNNDAAAYYDVMVKKFGEPAFIVKQPGGMAVWTENELKDTIFVRHELHDESIYHCRPLPHNDYVYSFVNYAVQPTLFNSVMSLSGSLSFDPLKKHLRARCGSIEANIATLTLATKIGEAQISLEYVQDNNIYTQWIMASKDAAISAKQYEELVYNVAHQKGNPKNTGYWAAAFPSGCDKESVIVANQYADSKMNQITSHPLRKV
jgi:hypothetical protein